MTTVHLRDIELYYEVSGEGQPLVFIHGLGSGARDWQFQVPVFCNRYQVITFDLRGHGKSSKPGGPYSIPLFADDTAALMKHLGLGPAHVVGISLGGMVALQLALSAPAQIASLTVVNAGPEFIVRTFGQRLQIWQRQAIVRLLGMQKMGEVLSQRLFPKPEQEELRAMFVERWAENDPRAYRDAMMAIVGWSVTDQLGSIRCPTLVMSADQDYTPVSMKEAYVVRMPHAKLVVIPDSRHATPVERPDEFNAALTAFLAKQA